MRPLIFALIFSATAAAQLTIEPQTLPAGIQGSSFGVEEVPPPGVGVFNPVVLDVPSGTGIFTYAILTGELPPGVELDPDGNFGGIPTQTGVYTFFVEASSTQDEVVTQEFTVTVGGPLTLGVTATIGAPFDLPLSCDPPEDYQYEMSDPPPPGLTFDPASGNVFGTPAGPAEVFDTFWTCLSEPTTLLLDLTIDVQQTQLTMTPPTLPNGNVGTTYAATMAANPLRVVENPVAFDVPGTTAELSYSIVSGALPPGLTLDPGGELLGAPTQAGVFTFTVGATAIPIDSFLPLEGQQKGQSQPVAQRNYSLTIQPAFPVSASAAIGSTYSLTLLCPDVEASYAYSIQGTIPAGLALDAATGAITGAPTGPVGVSTFTWSCVAAQNFFQARAAFTFNVLPRPSFSFSAAAGAQFAENLRFGGGTAPFLYSVVSGALPTGIALDPATGQLSGVPELPGDYGFVVEKVEQTESGSGARFQADVTVIVRRGVVFTLLPAVLNLEAIADGEPAAGAATVRSSDPGDAYTLQVRTSRGGRWLRATPAQGPTPKQLLVLADPAGLAPGRYVGHVEAQSTNNPGAVAQVEVAFTVLPGAPDELTVSPSGLQASFREGLTEQTMALRVGNAGSGPVLFDVRVTTENGGNWLAATPSSGTASGASPVTVLVTTDPTGLPPGAYKGAVIVNAPSAGGITRIPVTMVVTGGRGLLELSKSGLTFRVEQGSSPMPDSLFIREAQGRTIPWQAQAATLSGDPWLTVSPQSGSTGPQSSVNVAVSSSTLPAGAYFGQVEVDAPDAPNAPQSATVALIVQRQGTPLPPQLSEKGLAFAAQPSSDTQLVRGIFVSNPTGRPQILEFTSSFPGAPAFFTAEVANRNLAPGARTALVIRARALQAAKGVYRGFLDVRFAGSALVARLEVMLVTAPGAAGGPLFLTESGAEKDQTTCTPSALNVVNVEPGDNFFAGQGLPVPIEAFVLDDCGGAPQSAIVQAHFSNGDEPVLLTRNSRGGYSGVWTPVSVGGSGASLKAELVHVAQQADPDSQQEAQITIQANQVNLPGNSTRIGGALSGFAGVPVISPGGAVSAASFSSRDPLPPGAFISIFGGNLAPEAAAAVSLPLPLELSSVSVTAAGQPVALTYVSPGQINGVLPFGLTADTAQQVVVKHGNALSTPESISVSQAQPAVFTQNFSGAGLATVVGVRPDGSQYLVGPDSRLRAGDAAVIYCAGLGLVDSDIDASEAAPGDPLARTINSVVVAIGGIEAEVFFAGLAPGFAGLYQVNAMVRQGTPTGAQVPLVLTVNDIENPVVTVAVQ